MFNFSETYCVRGNNNDFYIIAKYESSFFKLCEQFGSVISTKDIARTPRLRFIIKKIIVSFYL